MASNSLSSTALSANKRKDHRSYPLGASLQARAVILARWRPSISVGRPGLGLSCKTSKPVSLYFFAQVDAVCLVTPTILATSVKVRPRFNSSKAVARLLYFPLTWTSQNQKG